MAPRQQPAAGQHQAGKAPQQPEEKRCTHCGSSHTGGGFWREHPTSGHRLCNACRKYADHHSGQLPPNSVLQRRPAEPRRMADVRRDMAQRRCLRCGSSSPSMGERASWNRHPATGEEWVCNPCRSRIQRHLRKQQRQEAKTKAVEEEQSSGHSSGGSGSEEGKQAPTPTPQLVSRKRRQERHGSEAAAPAAFHDGPAAAAKGRAGSKKQPAAGSGGARAVSGLLRQQKVPQDAVASGMVPQPAAQRRQRRKQAQPQHLPPKQPDWEPSLAPTVLAEGAAGPAGSEGHAADSLSGLQVAAGQNPVAAVGMAAAAAVAAPPTDPGSQPAVQAQQAAAAQAEPFEQQHPCADAGADLFQLLQQAIEVAAAAASGLTPELAAAFSMLLPLRISGQEALLRHLLQRHQYSAAAALMKAALQLAGVRLLEVL